MSLSNKRVIVLGGSAGIGLAVAKQARAAGAHVVIASHSHPRIERALGELRQVSSPASVDGRAVDLRSEAAIATLLASLGALDHLVYTAGEELMLAPLASLDLAAARQFFELRYWGALAAVKAAAPHLAKDGSIVLTSGAAGHRPAPGFLVGSSICAAMEAVARGLAVELAPIRVNIVTPGFVDTDLWSNMPRAAVDSMFEQAAARLPVGRVGTADDIAEHYLSFMRGRYVTGQALIVDGGGVLV
ncbi:MAG TPA: SDR family oxidoreductase [Kofleriaceae bacterium]|jgi:NAD(P)-dependent dehydrogenase (short-subunit alcohol dehydrogenase family)